MESEKQLKETMHLRKNQQMTSITNYVRQGRSSNTD